MERVIDNDRYLYYTSIGHLVKYDKGEDMEQFIYLGIIAGVVALAASFFYSKKVESYEINIDRVAEITEAIREGAMAFLAAEYKI